MQITATNLDTVLHDAGNLILARVMADGKPHKHQLRKTETVAYGAPLIYNTAEEVMCDVTDLPENTAAVIHHFPNRPTQQYKVKYGEIL